MRTAKIGPDLRLRNVRVKLQIRVAARVTYSRLFLTFKINKSAADLKKSKFVPRGLFHFLNGKRHGNEVKAELCSLLQSQQK